MVIYVTRRGGGGLKGYLCEQGGLNGYIRGILIV